MLGGTLESDKTIPEPTRRKNEREFRQLNRGSRQWFNIVHLERGLRYRPIQANAQQADYRGLNAQSRERIFELLHAADPRRHRDAGHRRHEDGRGAALLVRGGRRPVPGAPGRAGRTLVQGWGYSFKFDFGYKMPEADRVDLAASYADLPGITVGEVRDKAGLPRLPDDLVHPETGEPINDMVLNLPGPTEGPDGVGDRLGGAAGGPREHRGDSGRARRRRPPVTPRRRRTGSDPRAPWAPAPAPSSR